MSNQSELEAKLYGASEVEYYSDRREIIELYQDKYGEGNWRSEIKKAIIASNPDLNSKSVAREFQNDKRTGKERWEGTGRIQPSTRQKYENLGKSLPPKKVTPPKNGFKVRVKGKLDPSPKRKSKGAVPQDRTFAADFTGIQAYEFAQNPNLADFFEEYGGNGEQMAQLLEDGAQIDIEPF